MIIILQIFVLELIVAAFIMYNYMKYKDTYGYSKRKSLLLLIPAVYVSLDVLIRFIALFTPVNHTFLLIFSIPSYLMFILVLIFILHDYTPPEE